MSTALKRLMTEYKGIYSHFYFLELVTSAPEGIEVGPVNESNFFLWEALIAYD